MPRPPHNVDDVVTNARREAAEMAKLTPEEREAHYKHVAAAARSEAKARAPRRLRLNITERGGYGYVGCSLFQSDNGVNWGAIATTVVIPEGWFREVFGGAVEPGRRIEFEIANPHDVKED